jgi:hypothetical protein
MSEPQVQSLPPPLPRVRGLKNAHDIREELSRVYRDCRRGKLSTQDGSRLAFILTALHRMVEGAEVAARLDAIEQSLHMEEHNGHLPGPLAQH